MTETKRPDGNPTAMPLVTEPDAAREYWHNRPENALPPPDFVGAYARNKPLPSEGIETRKAWIIGSGIAGLAAAFYLIRDGHMPAANITVVESLDIEGGSLDGLDAPVLQARRGPITREDFLLTRLLELVVHADDLQRAVGRDDAPVLPEATAAVSAALAAVYAERGGTRDLGPGGTPWIRLATGRVPSEDPVLPLL